ncbi:hypothetical protein WG66_011626 [Moniliophthora roreri]|nr:hypothetical protein WG66_011626 [Moniliophthora roreri]
MKKYFLAQTSAAILKARNRLYSAHSPQFSALKARRGVKAICEAAHVVNNITCNWILRYYASSLSSSPGTHRGRL